MNQTEQTAIAVAPFDIFDKNAQLRTDFTDAEIAKLPAAKRKIFMALIAAWTGYNDADAALKETKQALYAVVKLKDEAAVDLGKARQITRIEALRDNLRARDETRG